MAQTGSFLEDLTESSGQRDRLVALFNRRLLFGSAEVGIGVWLAIVCAVALAAKHPDLPRCYGLIGMVLATCGITYVGRSTGTGDDLTHLSLLGVALGLTYALSSALVDVPLYRRSAAVLCGILGVGAGALFVLGLGHRSVSEPGWLPTGLRWSLPWIGVLALLLLVCVGLLVTAFRGYAEMPRAASRPQRSRSGWCSAGMQARPCSCSGWRSPTRTGCASRGECIPKSRVSCAGR